MGSALASDARYVGETSVGAGVQVFLALNEAADLIMQEALGSSADLVGHKFGEEAGSTTREGFHVAGNLMEAKSLASKKALVKTLGKKTAVAAASSVARTPGAGEAVLTADSATTSTTAALASSMLDGGGTCSGEGSGGGGILLGPRPR